MKSPGFRFRVFDGERFENDDVVIFLSEFVLKHKSHITGDCCVIIKFSNVVWTENI